MPFTQWIYPVQSEERQRQSRLLQREQGLPAMIADILTARGLSPDQIVALFSEGELEDPMELPDMKKAVDRIEQAIEAGEKIAVYGDYDCDGVTSTVILYSYLSSMGAQVSYYIPDRLSEGFGINTGAVDLLNSQGITLIVTVDNGTAALREIEYAKSLGIDVVVTDHHVPGPELPAAVAVVNPHRREYQGFRELCGAGVALKLIAALEGGEYEMPLESFAALAAIGTIGDVVSLSGENRMIVRKGLEMLPVSESAGLRALMTAAGLSGELTAGKIAFGICPRINAAGRMGSAKLAAELLLCENEEQASELAEQLTALNTKRRNEEEEILSAIKKAIEENPSLLLDRVLVLSAPGLNHGVVGIVASRVLSLYGKPVFIISEEGETATGSGRSLGQFGLFDAVSACSELLIRFGGHKLAAGLTLKTENIPVFRRMINEYAAKNFDRMPVIQSVIDRRLRSGDIELSNVELLSVLEPFGEGNPQPVFLMRDCMVEGVTPLSGGKHLKLRVAFEGKSVYVLCFKTSPESFIYEKGRMVDLLVTLEINTFRDIRSISIRMKDIRPAGFEEKKNLNAAFYYEKVRRGEPISGKIMAIARPSIPELRALYRLIRSEAGSGTSPELLYLHAVEGNMNYCKYRLSLDIFREVGLISISPDFSSMRLIPVEGKVDLERSEILKALNG